MTPSAPEATAVHATAVSIAGRALLIVGPSRSGKSRLAFALIEASTRARRIRLVGDDRVMLTPSGDGLIARPHPRIAGFIERRGLGIVALAHDTAAPVAAMVDLGRDIATSGDADARFPSLALARPADDGARRDRVLAWFSTLPRQTHHTAGKCLFLEAGVLEDGSRQDWNW